MIKGVHIELRAQLMHVERMIQVMRDAARWGYNAIMLEYYDRFPYQGRIAEAVAPDTLTYDDIDQLKSAARDLGLEIIPLVQNLGHLYWALRKPSLEPLGEGYGNEAYVAAQKHMKCLTSLCPSRPTSLEFFQEMASQVLEMHPEARYFHMGGDEVSLDPDCPHCAPRRRKEGVGAILTHHYAAVAEWIRSQGPEPVMWGDMILAHPESLEKMRGKVTVMDWNYWSTSEPSETCVSWGIPAEKIRKPEEWTEPQRRIVLPYLFTEDGTKMKPFPFTPLLKDQGFDVFVAPAVRSGGDSFFAPKAKSIDNAIGAARAAVKNDTLGMVVTSWALRRAPWPMTEQALIAGAMTTADPDASREEIEKAFALEHFGIPDPELAKIQILLGTDLNPLTSAITYLDPATGHWMGCDYDRRSWPLRSDPEVALKLSEKIQANMTEARALLARANPQIECQRERVAIWRWAIDCTDFFARMIPLASKEPGTHDVAELQNLRRGLEELLAASEEHLSSWYTDWTMISERYVRFGLHIEWCDRMMAEKEK